MLTATSSTINVNASTPGNGENRGAGNRRTTTTTARFVPSATQRQAAERSCGRGSFRARNTDIKGKSRGQGRGGFSGRIVRGSSTLGSEGSHSGGEGAVIDGQVQQQQLGQFQPQQGRGLGRARGSGIERGQGTSRGRGSETITAPRGRGRGQGSSSPIAELGQVLGQISAPPVRGRGSTPSTSELERNLGQFLGRGRAAAQVQLAEAQNSHLSSHSQQEFSRPAGLGPHLQQPASRNPQSQQYQRRRIPIPGNANANIETIKGPLIARPRSALGAYTEEERTQLQNGFGVWCTGRPSVQVSAIRQFEGGQWVQNENWVDGGDNNNEITLVPVVDLTNMADGVVNAFGGGRRGRGGNGEGGSGRGRGGSEGGSGRGRGVQKEGVTGEEKAVITGVGGEEGEGEEGQMAV
ncbi:hypothetical protein BGX38DRAFT_1328847 [Terfezia claveryi]|nr:hypothetical protein BGX38DRAFT_1328847 [Terfezia claveryi]